MVVRYFPGRVSHAWLYAPWTPLLPFPGELVVICVAVISAILVWSNDPVVIQSSSEGFM
jgi:hypothetical protein